jgi:hypothetical protein
MRKTGMTEKEVRDRLEALGGGDEVLAQEFARLKARADSKEWLESLARWWNEYWVAPLLVVAALAVFLPLFAGCSAGEASDRAAAVKCMSTNDRDACGVTVLSGMDGLKNAKKHAAKVLGVTITKTEDE